MTFGEPVLYTQPTVFVTYLIFNAELTRGLACSYSCSIGRDLHTAIKDLDLEFDLAVAGPDTSLLIVLLSLTVRLALYSLSVAKEIMFSPVSVCLSVC